VIGFFVLEIDLVCLGFMVLDVHFNDYLLADDIVLLLRSMLVCLNLGLIIRVFIICDFLCRFLRIFLARQNHILS